MTRDRTIYQRLLADLEKAHEALDVVDRRIHELLDEMDQQRAEKIQQEHQQWMEDNDNG